MNGAKQMKRAAKKGRKTPSLFDVAYYRLILDEAQTICTSKTGNFMSTSALKAAHKICLTGTPFVNRPDDIHSLLSLLELEPLNDEEFFRKHITVPIQQGEQQLGLARLRTAMAQIALRRTKNNTKIKIVGNEYHLRRVNFPEGDHKNIHDILYYTARVAFDAVVKDVNCQAPESTQLTVMFEMVSFFCRDDGLFFTSRISLTNPCFPIYVLRVRQACLSGELIPKHRATSQPPRLPLN